MAIPLTKTPPETDVPSDRPEIVSQNSASVYGSVSGSTLVVGDHNVIYPPAPKPADVAKARRDYLSALRAACQALPLAPIGADDSGGTDITLDQVYIALDTTTPAAVDEKRKKKAAVVREEEKPLSALEAVAANAHAVLLGAPGSGKSTFVKRLLGFLAAAGLGQPAPELGIDPTLTPLLVTLRELAPRLGALALDGLPAQKRDALLLNALEEQVRGEIEILGKECVPFADTLLSELKAGRCFLALDGLDEVPAGLRERVRLAVAAAVRRFQQTRILVTCRVRSYGGAAQLPDFAVFTLAPFDADKIRAFAQAWYNGQLALKRIPGGKEEAQRKAADLAQAGVNLREMAENPMLLTSMALIHQRDTRLPDQRVKLYKVVIEILARRWQFHKMGERLPSERLLAFLKNDRKLQAALERLGYETQRDRENGSLERLRAIGILESANYLGDPGAANEFLDYIDQRAGLLVGRGGEPDKPLSYGFPHRSLQEYLAGCYMIAQRSRCREFRTRAAEGDTWDLASELAFEEMYHNRAMENELLDLAYELRGEGGSESEQQQRLLLWSAQIATLIGVQVIEQDQERQDGGAKFLRALRPQLISVLSMERLGALERAEAGQALAQLGDPRPEVMTVEHMQLCYVPAGSFSMGSGADDPAADDDEKPAHAAATGGFWLARFPVTQKQFQAFVAAGGYQSEQYWQEARQASYWSPEGFKGRVDDELRRGPRPYGLPFDLDNHPVVGVSWFEALAFCRWMGEKLSTVGAQLSAAEWERKLVVAALPAEGTRESLREQFIAAARAGKLRVTLPGEAEWEKAARGPHGTLYPWGNAFDARKANTAESGLRSTSAAGAYAPERSIYGPEEMSGNVFEWTRSIFKNYPYDPRDGREDLADSTAPRVLRGGSWYYSVRLARCAYRRGNVPNGSSRDAGFRVVVLPSAL